MLLFLSLSLKFYVILSREAATLTPHDLLSKSSAGENLLIIWETLRCAQGDMI